MAMTSMLVVAGCSDSGSNRFEVNQVDAQWNNGWLSLSFDQKLTLSSEARRALVHGVPLTIALELSLRDTSQQTLIAGKTARYEIRYLPLSDRYQLTSPDSTIKTYPRLRHALSQLSRPEVLFKTGALPGGNYELLVRTHLDQRKMPPPMRLPVLLSADWQHDSKWSSWPLLIEPGA